jgi:3-carboxy-cis,cis-muconate cycloisomerase
MQPLLAALVGDEEIGAHFTDAADIEAMLRFEAALAQSQAAVGLIPGDAAEAIARAVLNLKPDMPALAEGMQRDGVIVPALVAQLRASVGEPHRAHVHFGSTSQDVIDTSLILRLKQVIALFNQRALAVIHALEAVKARDGGITLMAQTRMKEALPFTAADKIETWLRPLRRSLIRLDELCVRLLVIQLGGPVGTNEQYGDKAGALGTELAARLGLSAAKPWHSARDNIAEFGSWLSLLTGILGKIGTDLVLMNQDKIGAVRLPGGGGSSALAHKQNPVIAETLIALGRFNAGMLGTLHQTLIHENERSGAAWTLEWMVLPQMVIAAGSALRHAKGLAEGMGFQA